MAQFKAFTSAVLEFQSKEEDALQSLFHKLLDQDGPSITSTALRWEHQDGRVQDTDRVVDLYTQLDALNSAFEFPEGPRASRWEVATDVTPCAGQLQLTDPSQAIIAEAKKAAVVDEKIRVLAWGGEADLAQTLHEFGSQDEKEKGAPLDDSLVPTVRIRTCGTAPDSIMVRVSGDAHEGDPNFALVVNGRVVDATNLVTADHDEGEWETFVFHGDFALDGTDRVGIQFTNDHYERDSGDRNLYVDAVIVNGGEMNSRDESLTRAGTEFWDF